MISYIPTIQSLSNVSGVLKNPSGQPWKTSNMLTSPPPSSNNQSNSASDPSSTYGGFNYSNPFNGYTTPLSNISGDLTGQDYAEAAKAGTASGLQMNPSTGEVW